MRISRGLPLNACVNARACTSVLSTCGNLFLFLLILPTITNSTKGWPRLGLPTLLTAGEREQVRSEAKNDVMRSCVCLITLNYL